MKKIINIFPILLIILGSALEILYYTKRFINDGIELYLSIIIGIALTLFLSLLMLKRSDWRIWFIIIPLAVYSIICTSAGQSFSLSELHNKEVQNIVQEDNRQQQILEYLSDIDLINSDLNQLSQQITVTTTWARNKYGNAIEAVQERQDKLREEKKQLQEKINNLRSQQTINSEVKKETTNIYQFYKNLFGFNATFLQFFLQTLLSAFIAFMSPVGIIILSRDQKQIKKPQIKKQQINYKPLVERWVSISWTANRKQGYKKIIEKSQFLKYYNGRFANKDERLRMTEEIYNKIFSAAISIKAVDKNYNIVNNYSEDQIKNLINNKLK